MRARYRFSHGLALQARPETVHEVLVDLEWYPSWWPQVRAVARVDDDRALVVCRSVLPYDLELELTATRRDPLLLEVAIGGPLDGFARWTLTPTGTGTATRTRLDYLQEVDAQGALAAASYLVRPALTWNHRRMMAGFDAGISGACAGRRTRSPS